MLIGTKSLYGTKIAATDGDVGHIKDFFFDDKNWVVRYVVVEASNWLPGRLVLLAPHAFGHLDVKSGVLKSHLSKAQIENSPSIDAHRPITRQFEIDYYRHYGWPGYWNGGDLWGIGAFPGTVHPIATEAAQRFQPAQDGDKHLRSALAVTGYAVESNDGATGEVSGFILDDRSWAVRDVVIGTGMWPVRKEILVSTSDVTKIKFEESTVFVNLSKEEIRSTAEDGVASAGTTGAAGFQD